MKVTAAETQNQAYRNQALPQTPPTPVHEIRPDMNPTHAGGNPPPGAQQPKGGRQ